MSFKSLSFGRVKKSRLLFYALFVLSLAGLIGPYLFVHFPRTCIPQVDPQFQGTSSKIIILSGERCTSNNTKSKCRHLGQYSYYNRREYQAHHHGRYELRDNFTAYFDGVVQSGLVPAWAKIKILQDELERVGDGINDWIFWIDTDALIVNMGIELERFVDDRYSLIVSKDLNSLNAGVFMLKVNDWSRQLVQAIWSRANSCKDEQECMIKVLSEPAAESERHVKYIPQCGFNSYWHVKTLYEMYRPGDFVIHWAGHNYDRESFKDWQLLRYFKIPQ